MGYKIPYLRLHGASLTLQAFTQRQQSLLKRSGLAIRGHNGFGKEVCASVQTQGIRKKAHPQEGPATFKEYCSTLVPNLDQKVAQAASQRKNQRLEILMLRATVLQLKN